VPLPSKSAINRCGDLLRDYLNDPSGDYDWEQVNYALDVLGEFRSSFQYPLTKVTMGLRVMVKAEAGTVVVAQRLKRMDRILGKLQRMPGTNVARLEDIGGCRAVLARPDDVTGVLRRIRKRWDVVRERDYITDPKPSGYRAFHVVVERDGRRIEVQLRTQGQQDWADSLEAFASALDLPLKDDKGPEEVLGYFHAAGEGIYRDEYGVAMDDEFMASFQAARTAMTDWAARWGRR
jgi:ppGpp synthetase/RelA/SpoT-type nucleotidyltranferase